MQRRSSGQPAREVSASVPAVDAQAILPQSRLSYADRLAILHRVKLEYTRIKRETQGPRDSDDQGMVPLPPEASETVEAVSGSGVVIRDVVLKGYEAESNHPSGGFFGASATGHNFRRLLEVHPTHFHPADSMAGAYMVNFNSYRKPGWNPEFDYSHLAEDHRTYGLDHGIGGLQHFCPDLSIGLELGWGGLLDKIRRGREANPGAGEFYEGLEQVVLGMQNWIGRHAGAIRDAVAAEARPELRENLETMADICERLVDRPPATFREACQWLVFFQAGAKMYNGSGEWGQLDELLRPFYDRDTAAGTLTDEEATFHIACLLLSETAYIQIGGPNADGSDRTSRVSFLVLEAIHRLKIPANIAIRVGEKTDRKLFDRGLEILFEDRMGFPKFVGDRAITEGYMRNGYPVELARTRIYAGCHWMAIPGREYGMMDLIKVDFARLLELSLEEVLGDPASASVRAIWERFRTHLDRAVDVVAAGIDFHLEHMHKVFPELYLDLFCHGPLERGLDVTNGGVDIVNIGVDGASLATVADSFAALEERVELEEVFSWEEVREFLRSNWSGPQGEKARLAMRNIRRFGSGDSRADSWAERIATAFTAKVAERRTPNGVLMIPGLFSWAKVIAFGKRLGATPNGRRAGEPVSHGPNPEPGFNGGEPGTPTQLVQAVAAVQPGYGNAAPLQLDLDPGLGATEGGLAAVSALIRGHFALGGTMININVLDRHAILEAQKNPAAFPDLIVRVTGFSAYFASLSDDMRAFVVDRIVREG